MSEQKRNELGVFFHMMYELNKGLRNLALLTTTKENFEMIKERLIKCHYEYIVEELKSGFVNVFFGNSDSIEVLRKFNKKSLRDFTDEEDFILGVLLGYNVEQQCKRYISRKKVS
ncbi:hypothetical protein IX317_001595 [Fusobacterium sp. DD29]|uniref:DUF2023 family protein n=1 Tax=unclassified Fusobacterium TaxID=2648384 RepID=UPI001B8B56CC|nr:MULTISPECIES: DUF2023 family protein [unclassified Fusobacterium]MBR8701763.1 hypothetical protein [Fusobacterium sp. DD45]MBR8711544.1 hypothetical protein [Fusobacterium sp. DD28]MBR8749915.1 hypothetical protein [Fusobacterium sp. DD29]MBR8752093.1 hypothetical protein [Fusobacterium sp. DD26]MBR8762157.1 hypothetical protein [Fusobacterium sp. DD25]